MDLKIITTEALKYLYDKVSSIHKKITKDAFSSYRIDNMMDNYDVCKLLNISQRTLQHFRDTDKLPFVLFHGKCLYKQEDVERFLEIRKAKNVKPKKG